MVAGAVDYGGYDVTFASGAAVSQYGCVKIGSADMTVIQTAADTDISVGFAQTAATASGEYVEVRHYGVTRAIASGAISRGTRVAPDASGKVKTAATGDQVCGIALEAAGANNDLIRVLIERSVDIIA
ncbi:MAG: DUF2190 family protein [Candidatus Eisenbacteria bacterium]|uniref:DUF2190 family protein n=1 Tax=Eiseniibacteriota bacterium TaxID=2212470 RepID=A0A956M2D0_UNCEI|nr:DUF2190 family protein [Candidatus Eisenbacteria bacterium]